jgi:5,10-methylenetetrahydromethanopterin reductase
MRICCAFATSLDSPEHIAVAERFGYERAWLYDASQHYPDVWMVLALAAARTSRIGLGPGVLVPQVRHPMVNVAGAATLSALAPGRVAVAFGRGFTGARAMSAKPSGWAYVREYVAAFRALLAGETVDWQGERLRMLHPAGNAPALHSSVPVLIAAGGPKGAGVAHEVGDGLFAAMPLPEFVAEFAWTSLQVGGTVLRPGEALDTPRVRATAGPSNAFAYHARYEFGGDVTELPAGQTWLDVINRTEERDRHLAVHERHLAGLNAADAQAWAAGSWNGIPSTTVTGTAAQTRERLTDLEERGVTDIVYQPSGNDIAGELDAFMQAATLSAMRR